MLTKSNIVLVVVAAICVLSQGQVLPVSLRQKSTLERTFVDADGREVFMHGVNAVVKGPPWYPKIDEFDPLTSLNEQDFQILASVGMNVIRLGVMWPGVEPVRGQYNETYLDQIDRILQIGAKYGFRFVLDHHQDVLSEKFCGEGVPAWAAQVTESWLPFPQLVGNFTADDYDPTTGFPTRQACAKHDWASLYATAACSNAFQNLYTNYDNLTDSWGAMWAHVALRFKGRSEVLGLELFNEPWAGDVYSNPLLFIPGLADKEVLQGCYDKLVTSIRQVDQDRLILFAGVTWADFGAGFTAAPGGAAEADRSVFAYHYYEPPQFANSEVFDFGVHLNDARRMQTGYMLTEFGSPGYNSAFDDDASAADGSLLSWIMWEWKDYCRETPETLASKSQWAEWGACKTGYGGVSWSTDGKPDPNVLKKLARSYPMAVAGQTTSFSFNATTGAFALTYSISTKSLIPTEIFVSEEWHYPSGLDITVSPAEWAVAKHDVGSNRVYVAAAPLAVEGGAVTVTINPKAAATAIDL